MLHLDEQALVLLLQAKSLRAIEIRETGQGFGIFVHMERANEADGEGMLITTRMKHQKRKEPRTWVSIDSCLQFLKSKSPELPEITIKVQERGD